MKRRHALLVPAALALAAVPGAASGRVEAVLHEPIPADPEDDAALGVAVAGDLPATLDTRSGLVHAPDPSHAPPDKAYGAGGDLPGATYMADRDTRRPTTLPYDDPFDPSTAPFKRLVAFDAVDASFRLYVKDPSLAPIAAEAPRAGDDLFYGDLRVELAPDRHVRVPSVGPGARLVRVVARAGASEIAVRLVHDGADNWFVDLPQRAPASARLLMELAIPRASFGGGFGDPDWGSLPPVAPLPPNVAESARAVNDHIHVDRVMRPREAVTKLVAYYRSFVDSDEPPPPTADVYRDLALSQKGVCRHRAFAFTISALALGIPTRMAMNEAHAWVEVGDGTLWRRVDLGGAGRALASDLSRAEARYQAPPDPFRWPTGAERGDDLADRARAPGGNGNGNGGGGGNGNGGNGGGALVSPPAPTARAPGDRRAPSALTLAASKKDAARGAPFRVAGDVTSDGETCGGVRVDVVLRSAAGEALLGSLATDERGHYERSVVVPQALPVGSYAVHARTPGDTRCGPGESP